MIGQSRRDILGLLAGSAIPAPPLAHPWPAFKARYLAPDGRIVDTGNGGISHSEGQGYGLVLAESAGDRSAFELMWRWTATVLAREDALLSWRFDPAAAEPVSDRNNATDGDLLVAWALTRGARRWRERSYAATAQRMLAAVKAQLIVQTPIGPVLLPGREGFQREAITTLNPSYWVWPALAAFTAFDPGGPWAALQTRGEALLDKAAFGAARLPTDWIDITAEGTVAPAAGRPARFGFDAVRTPLYLAWAGGGAGRLAPFRQAWAADLDAGRAPPAWLDVTTGERAPYPASPGVLAIAEWVCGRPAAAPRSGDYYSDVLTALVALARQETPRLARRT